MNRPIAIVSLLAFLVAGCLASVEETATARPSPSPSGDAVAERIPIVIDADFDHSDIAAILVLLRDPGVNVRAITIAGTGLVHCQGGRLVARYLLEELGRTDIPFGCGRQRGGEDATPFPDDWRVTADGGYGLDITPRVETETPADAVDVLRAAINGSPSPLTIVALGPLTNLEDAFAADPTLAGRVAGIHSMLGTIAAPGNVFVDGHDGADPLEWNAFADPSAVEAVLATGIPVTLVPLDATDDVPVPADLTERLAEDHAAGAADLMYELLLRNPSRLDVSQGQQLWDELAALTLTRPDLVTWSDSNVVVGDGGRLASDAAGRPVRFAAAADAPAVEAALLDALRRGGPRATPFRMAGTIKVTWDGRTCAMTTESAGAGLHTLTYRGPAGTPSGVLFGGVRDPHQWSEVVRFVETFDLEVEQTPPAWLIQGGQAYDEAGAGAPVAATMKLESATYGPICATGQWPDLTFTPGEPFEAGG